MLDVPSRCRDWRLRIHLACRPIPEANIASVGIWLHAYNPRLRAMQAEADAADTRVYPTGALPDPMAWVELDVIDSDRPSLLPNKVSVTSSRLKQQFPLWGKGELSRDVVRFEAQSVRYERDAAALEILAKEKILQSFTQHGVLTSVMAVDGDDTDKSASRVDHAGKNAGEMQRPPPKARI